MYSPNPLLEAQLIRQSYGERVQEKKLQEAVRSEKSAPQSPILFNLGDALISLGKKLKTSGSPA